MSDKKSVKKYAGVYYSESIIRKWRERPDRCFYIAFTEARTRKLRWERCGWASEGWTPEAAQRRRYEILEQDRAGDYKPKQETKKDQLTFAEYMDNHYLPWADENKKHARDDRSLYRNWLEPLFGSLTLKAITPFNLERLKKEMREKGKSPATVIHALGLIRQAFNRAVTWHLWSGENPCRSVTFPKVNNARQRFLSYQEADQLLQALEKRSPQVNRMARMSLYGGLRLGEIFGLTWSNVDLEHGILTVLDAKNGESRPIFITDQIRAVIEELKRVEPDELLFKTRFGQPVVWMSKVFHDVVEELDLNKGISDRREKVTFHTLRHTFASWSVMSGVPLFVVGKALGHKTTVMTQRYSHLSPESQRAAFEAVANFSRESSTKRVETSELDL
jgi:integrase